MTFSGEHFFWICLNIKKVLWLKLVNCLLTSKFGFILRIPFSVLVYIQSINSQQIESRKAVFTLDMY